VIAARPLPNRVDPFGDLFAVAERGLLMGNRGGRLHDGEQALGARRWTSRRWIACLCEFRGRRREVWGRGYSELFFLDEPTALAAGHRPCFECRRAEATAFLRAAGRASADALDARLHDERLDGRKRRRHLRRLGDLPDGAMIARDGCAFAVRGDALWPWSFAGYGAAIRRERGADVETLTPPTTLTALRAGYVPLWAKRAA